MAVHMVTIKTFISEFDANLALAKLETHGIPGFIDNTNDTILGPTGIGYNLRVDDDFIEEALAVLEEMESGERTEV
jgi:hypothetical protein